MGSSDRTMISMRVHPETLEGWDQHVEEHEAYSSRTHLMQIAVENQIRRDRADDAGDRFGGESEIDIDLSGIEERLDKGFEELGRRFDLVESRITVGWRAASTTTSPRSTLSKRHGPPGTSPPRTQLPPPDYAG